MKHLFQIIFVIIALFQSAVFGQVKFSATAESAEISQSSPAKIVLKLSVEKNWHIYGKTSEIGSPTKFDFVLPDGFKLASLEWPREKTFKSMGIAYEGYDAEVEVVAKISTDENPKTPTERKIAVKAQWLACADTCVPGEASAEISLALTPSSAKSDGGKTPNENAADADLKPPLSPGGFFAVLLGAFVGGMILNLMPCVFPVIGIKILSFAKSAGGSRRIAVLNAMFYTLGIVLSFLILAVLLLALRAAGENLGWGFQLQNPIFSASMALLFFAMAMSFAGAFEIGAGFAGGAADSEADKKNKYLEAALSGVVAVLVASPCTAPFMGSALGAALSTDISAAQSLSIFAFIGLGMASPYVALSAIPQLSRFMPRPGAWMEVFKQILSIPLFATVIWLVWLYTKQTDSLGYILSALLLLAIGARIYGMYSMPHFSKRARLAALAAAAISCMGALWICAEGSFSPQKQSESAEAPNAWSAEKVEQLRKSGKSVYVDFTASWCLTCQYNKRILHDKSTENLFRKNNIVVLVGDWTNRNEAISKELEKYGRAGVPLNLLFPPRGEPVVLPAILTESAMIEAVDKIK